LVYKLLLVGVTWGLALVVSFGLRFWGHQHPEPFIIRPFLVWLLLLIPVIGLGLWVLVVGFFTPASRSLAGGERESLQIDQESD
jgi:hypothetical protein